MILSELYDDVFVSGDEYYTHIRETARSIAIREDGLLGFLHVVGEDDFGVRDHLETFGGGIEVGESYQGAMIRELAEEIGHEGVIVAELGTIIDRYRHIHRITVSHYFIIKIGDRVLMNRTEAEQQLIHDIQWLTLEQALKYYEVQRDGVNHLIEVRDYQALLAYQAYLKTESVH